MAQGEGQFIPVDH